MEDVSDKPSIAAAPNAAFVKEDIKKRYHSDIAHRQVSGSCSALLALAEDGCISQLLVDCNKASVLYPLFELFRNHAAVSIEVDFCRNWQSYVRCA